MSNILTLANRWYISGRAKDYLAVQNEIMKEEDLIVRRAWEQYTKTRLLQKQQEERLKKVSTNEKDK